VLFFDGRWIKAGVIPVNALNASGDGNPGDKMKR